MYMVKKYPYLAFTFKGRIKSLIRAEEKFNGYIVEYIYDYYMKNRFICAEEVAQELSVSKPYAYKLIRQLNEELKAKGFITISGRVNRQYFYERLYGAGNPQGDTTMSYKAGQE